MAEFRTSRKLGVSLPDPLGGKLVSGVEPQIRDNLPRNFSDSDRHNVLLLFAFLGRSLLLHLTSNDGGRRLVSLIRPHRSFPVHLPCQCFPIGP
jgi:hypothetical protein